MDFVFSWWMNGKTTLVWPALVDTHFHVFLAMFNRVQVRALAGPLEDIHRVFPKSLLCWLGCVLKIIVTLEVEPSSCWKVISVVEQVFIADIPVLYFAPSSIPSNLNILPTPAAEKHLYSMLLAPPCFTVWRVLVRWWAVPCVFQAQSLELRPHSSILISWARRILFLSLRVLQVLFSKIQLGFIVFCTKGLVSSPSAIKAEWVGGCSDVCPSRTLSPLHTGSLELRKRNHLDHLSYLGSLPSFAQFGWAIRY